MSEAIETPVTEQGQYEDQPAEHVGQNGTYPAGAQAYQEPEEVTESTEDYTDTYPSDTALNDPAAEEDDAEQAPVDQSGELARALSRLDPTIQRALWAKILSFSEQRIPAETALHLAARAIEDELRQYL